MSECLRIPASSAASQGHCQHRENERARARVREHAVGQLPDGAEPSACSLWPSAFWKVHVIWWLVLCPPIGARIGNGVPCAEGTWLPVVSCTESRPLSPHPASPSGRMHQIISDPQKRHFHPRHPVQLNTHLLNGISKNYVSDPDF